MARAFRLKQRGKWLAGLAAMWAGSCMSLGHAAETQTFGAAPVINAAAANSASSRRTNQTVKSITPIATPSVNKAASPKPSLVQTFQATKPQPTAPKAAKEDAVAPIVSSANLPRPGSKGRENVIPDIAIPALLPQAPKMPLLNEKLSTFAYPQTATPDEPRLIQQTSGVEEETKIATLGMPLLDAKQAPPLLLRKIEDEPAKLGEMVIPPATKYVEAIPAPIIEKSTSVTPSPAGATKLPLAMWSTRVGDEEQATAPAIKFVEAKPAPIIEKPAPASPSPHHPISPSPTAGFKVRLMDVRQVETAEEAEQLLKPREEQVASLPKKQPTPLTKDAKPIAAKELIEEVVPMVPMRAPRPATQPIFQQAQPPTTPKPEEIPPGVNDPRITRGLRDTPSEPLPAGSPFEVIEEQGKLTVMVRRSKLLRTQVDVYRTAVVDDGICEVVQFTPREVSIIGKSTGATHVTFWFEDANMKPLTYLVKVEPDTEEIRKLEQQYMVLEQMIAEMFPNSKIRLTVAANKLIVRGQARDSEEASQIMSLIRSQQQGVSGRGLGGGNGSLNEGIAAAVLTDSAQGSGQRANLQIINMMRVPGVQQVALRVKIAELNRTAARNFGVDVGANINVTNNSKGSQLFLNSLLNTANGATVPILGQFDGDDIKIGLNFLQEQGVVKLLAEPTLVTISGRPATFVAGGEFAVPTAVGVAGLSAVSTDFRAFGSIISFLPTIVDKDRIRLQVSPEFSQVNASLSVNNIPGLRTRTANTTVEMREGQTLAIAGLLEESMTANNRGNLPFFARLFGKRSVSRSETELIILVTPELVHPMEPEEVPPLPGFDVMEPTNAEFFLHGSLEGNPTREYRSTVWPRLHKRYGSGGPSMTSGPFGHGQ